MIWAAGLLVLSIAACALCWFGAGILLSPPGRSPLSISPEHFGLEYERIAFKTRDGLELKGWFLPSPRGDKRTILMCHGWTDNKGIFLEQTHFLNNVGGFNLVYFDFRFHGESEGNITTSGGLETIDFDAAVDWLRRVKPDFADSVGVFGLSMGAAVTVVSMARHPQLRCAAVESPFADYNTVIQRALWNKMRIPYYPFVALTVLFIRWRVTAPEIAAFDPVQAASRIFPRPLLVIGGGRDALMTPADVGRVYEAARQPKQLWMVARAPHAKCRETAGAEYDERLIDFFSRHL